MSVRLIVFHPENLDRTTKPGPSSRPFVLILVVSPTRTTQRRTCVSKAYITHRNARGDSFFQTLICELTWLKFSTDLHQGIIFSALWMTIPGHPDRGFNNSYPLILLHHLRGFLITYSAGPWSHSQHCSHEWRPVAQRTVGQYVQASLCQLLHFNRYTRIYFNSQAFFHITDQRPC